ncbi:MAG: hypothetical protein ACK4HV_00530 [Parachlamydiaceae bacterium]
MVFAGLAFRFFALFLFLAFDLSASEGVRSRASFEYAIYAFQTKCTTCHSSEYSLYSERVLPSYWIETIDRMRLMTDSDISQEEAHAIADYMIFDSMTRRKNLFDAQLNTLNFDDAEGEKKTANNIIEKYGGRVY